MATEIVNNIRQAVQIQHNPVNVSQDDFRRALTFLDEFKGSPQCLEVSMMLVRKEVREDVFEWDDVRACVFSLQFW